MIEISGASIGMFVLAAMAAAGGVSYILKKDTGIEERRRSAIDLAGSLDGLGLDVLSNVVKDYAVGDYGQLMLSFRTLFRELKSPEVLLDRLSKNFKAQLTARLENHDECRGICEVVRPYLDREDAESID